MSDSDRKSGECRADPRRRFAVDFEDAVGTSGNSCSGLPSVFPAVVDHARGCVS